MKLDLRAPLDELLAYAREKYSVIFETVSAGGHTLEILQIEDMQAYIEKMADSSQPSGCMELPFWAKIWTASILLGHFISRLEPGDKKALEIGAGVGVAGLFAAAHGIETVISDVCEDALVFARINVLKNDLSDRVRVVRADFTGGDLGEKFDYILGAEVLYQPCVYRGLLKFLLRHIKPEKDAEVMLANEYTRPAVNFFSMAAREFISMDKTVGCKSTEPKDGEIERHLITIHRLKPRKYVQA